MTVEHRSADKPVQQVVPGVLSAVGVSQSGVMSDNHSLTHRMHVFRMRLLHFVNSLHDYVMTRVCAQPLFLCATLCTVDWTAVHTDPKYLEQRARVELRPESNTSCSINTMLLLEILHICELAAWQLCEVLMCTYRCIAVIEVL